MQKSHKFSCPLDETIMPSFEYSNNHTRAAVSFPAHKFPHTSSVYYQCNISLCINNGNCIVPECKSQQPSVPVGSAPGSPTNAANQNGPNNSNNGQNSLSLGGVTIQATGSRRKRHSSNLQNNLQQLINNNDPANGKPIKSGINNNNNNKNADTIDRFDDMSFDVYSGLYVNDATDEG